MIKQENPEINQTPSVRKALKSSRHFRLAVLVLAVIVVGGILTGTHHKAHSRKAVPEASQVSINASGFFPKTIQINAGQAVNWINYDTSPHEVAADPYPNNDSILGFDNTVVLRTGDSYAFSFIHQGTYTYHDQLNPLKLQGSVVVK